MYYLFKAATFLAARLPRWLGFRLTDGAGVAIFLLNARARHQADANLRRVLGPEARPLRRRLVALRAFRTAARNYYDLFRLPSIKQPGQQVRMKVVGWENLEQALAEGHGAVVAAPHMGAFELMTRLAVERSVRITIPIERVKPEKLFQLMVQQRSTEGVNVVPADNGALRAMYQALRRNEIVVIAADRDVLGNGAPVCFFGEPTTVPDAPAVISLRTGAPILVGYTLRRGDNSYYVELQPPLPAPAAIDARQGAQALTEAVTARIEDIIRKHPDQWVVFEPVWRDRGN
ncbi:MAG: lysophospholipid acyltransferase family protein [Chloroflexi bacterium]|nr:lysophospholipid acyltransferase family protein [Chloroflexota bacterium]